MKSKQKISKKDLIIKIILIIIIIILLLHNCVILKNKHKKQEPTGNVNIIEIICDKDDTCDVDKEDDKKDNSTTYKNAEKNANDYNNKKSDNNKSNSEDAKDEQEDAGLLVLDKTISWEKTTQAKIFTNSMYELNDKIAPESYNTYQFVVKNGTNYNINYTINFIENNPYNINMKYKLKKNDTYLVDHYVDASELNQVNLALNSKKNDTYYLEWKWVSSSNDTQIGESINAKYELKIEVKAESNNG